ncbi:MAG: phosphoribosyltransferase [Hyphomicrobiales bacterium]
MSGDGQAHERFHRADHPLLAVDRNRGRSAPAGAPLPLGVPGEAPRRQGADVADPPPRAGRQGCCLLHRQSRFLRGARRTGEPYAEGIAPLAPDIIVGLPTLGLALAPPLARRIGHANFVPLGTSRKFWYEDALSEPVSSLTTTGAGRRLFVDPNLVPRLAGRRVVVVDDTISSGSTALATLKLMSRIGAEVSGLAFAMSQGRHWRRALAEFGPEWPDKVSFVFESPHLVLTSEGWMPA